MTQVASYGAYFRKPVYVLCETMKFSEKSKIDGMIVNEGVTTILDESENTFNKIALTYDLTPPKNISLVISEVGLLPPSSVSVVLNDLSSYEMSKIGSPLDLEPPREA